MQCGVVWCMPYLQVVLCGVEAPTALVQTLVGFVSHGQGLFTAHTGGTLRHHSRLKHTHTSTVEHTLCADYSSLCYGEDAYSFTLSVINYNKNYF